MHGYIAPERWIRLNKIILLFILFVIASGSQVFAETIRLKDGQVFNGTIISRTQYSITVKTRYQTRRIFRSEILSIRKETKKLQSLYILTINREIISGYLVEEDSLQVQYKTSPDSASVKAISKLDIIKMSNEEIKPIDLAMGLKAGIFFPFNTGGAKLEPSAIYLADIGISSIINRNFRILLEAGYTQSENKETSARFLQLFPATINAEYRLKTFFDIEAATRAGIGMAMIKYESGENVEMSGVAFTCAAGFRITYPVKLFRFHIGLFADYIMIGDSSGILHSGAGGICTDYRF